jgi:phosphonate transport system substrate-binding protein
VLRKGLPTDVMLKMTAMMAALPSTDPECAYGFMAGKIKAIAPISHADYEVIVEARKLKSKS